MKSIVVYIYIHDIVNDLDLSIYIYIIIIDDIYINDNICGTKTLGRSQ